MYVIITTPIHKLDIRQGKSFIREEDAHAYIRAGWNVQQRGTDEKHYLAKGSRKQFYVWVEKYVRHTVKATRTFARHGYTIDLQTFASEKEAYDFILAKEASGSWKISQRRDKPEIFYVTANTFAYTIWVEETFAA